MMRTAKKGFTLIEIVMVMVVLSIIVLLALPKSSGQANVELQAAFQAFQSDYNLMLALSETAQLGEIYAMYVHFPDAPVVDAGQPEMWDALACAPGTSLSSAMAVWPQSPNLITYLVAANLAPTPTGACCDNDYPPGDCQIGNTQTQCESPDVVYTNGGAYLGDNSECPPYPCLPPDTPPGSTPALPGPLWDGTPEAPNASPALPVLGWPGTGGTSFNSNGNPDGDIDSYYACGTIDNSTGTFTPLTRPDGSSWVIYFSSDLGLGLVSVMDHIDNSNLDVYSEHRALRFTRQGPSRDVQFYLSADSECIKINISTSGRLSWKPECP